MAPPVTPLVQQGGREQRKGTWPPPCSLSVVPLVRFSAECVSIALTHPVVASGSESLTLADLTMSNIPMSCSCRERATLTAFIESPAQLSSSALDKQTRLSIRTAVACSLNCSA